MSEIVDIIPKITSPLAVICFIAYIVYLFKRSDDKKIEKILTSPSTAQQKEVVQNILKDDPEVQIDPITDPREARKIAERIIANKLARHNKNMNTFLIFSAIFAITFLLSVLIPKITGGTVPTETETEKTSQTWAQVEAAKNKYPYAALSVVQHIKIRDVILPDSSKKRMAEFRNHYTLSATKDIKATDPIFKEQYLTNNARVVAWPGSEQQEMESIADNLYWVKFDLKKDEVRTLTTGANYYYDIPLAHTTATSCFGDIIGSNQQWMTCYPNTIDYIDNLLIIIEAEGISLQLPPVSTYKKEKQGNIIKGEGSCKVFSDNNKCTLTARWTRIAPGECVGLLINWSLPG